MQTSDSYSGDTRIRLERVVRALSSEMHQGDAGSFLSREALPDSISLSEDLGLDSFARLELRRRLETEFGLEISEASVFECDDFAQLLDVLNIEASSPETSRQDIPVASVDSLVDILRHRSRSCGSTVFLRTHNGSGEPRERTFEQLADASSVFAQYLLAQEAYRRNMRVYLDLDRLDTLVVALFGTLLAGGIPEDSTDAPGPLGECSETYYVDESALAEAMDQGNMGGAPEVPLSQSPALRVTLEDARWVVRDRDLSELPVEILVDHEQLMKSAKRCAASLGLFEGGHLLFFEPRFPLEVLLVSTLASLFAGTSIELISSGSDSDTSAGLPDFKQVLERRPDVVLCSVAALHHSLTDFHDDAKGLVHTALKRIVPYDFSSTNSDAFQLAELLDDVGLGRVLLTPIYGLEMGGLVLTKALHSTYQRDILFRKRHLQKKGIAREFALRNTEASRNSSDTLAFPCLGVPHRSDHIRIADRFGKEASDSEIGQLEFQLPYERSEHASGVSAETWCTRGERGFYYRGELYLVPSSLATSYWRSWLRSRGHALRWYLAAMCLVPIGVSCILLSPNCRIARLFAKYFARALFFLGGTPLSLSYAANLDRRRAQVLVANHASFLDAIALTALLPTHVSYAVKKELENAGIASAVLRKLRASFIERSSAERGIQDVDAIQKRVEQGETFVFFPEGTFTRRSELSAFRLGAFKIAAEVGCDVVPLVIRGSRSVVRDVQFSPRPGRIDVEVFNPYAVPAKDWSSLCEVRDEVRSLIAKTCGEPDALQLL